MSSPIQAVIDVGTNSVKLLVARVGSGLVDPIYETSTQTRLGQGCYTTRTLQATAMARTAEAVAGYVLIARQKGAHSVSVIATSAAREAKNADAFAADILQRTGLPLRVLSGEEEAELVFRGITTQTARKGGEMLIADVGGGSTEIICGTDNCSTRHLSLPLGTVRLMEAFPLSSDPPGTQILANCRETVRATLVESMSAIRGGKGALTFPPSDVVGTGGTATLLGRIHHGLDQYDREILEGTRLDRNVLTGIVAQLWSLTESARKQLPGLPAEKADVILYGSLIFEVILELMDSKALVISLRGLRQGLLLAME